MRATRLKNRQLGGRQGNKSRSVSGAERKVKKAKVVNFFGGG